MYCAPKWALILPKCLFLIEAVAPAQPSSPVLLTRNLNLNAIFPANIYSIDKKKWAQIVMGRATQEEIINLTKMSVCNWSGGPFPDFHSSIVEQEFTFGTFVFFPIKIFPSKHILFLRILFNSDLFWGSAPHYNLHLLFLVN